MSTDGNGCAAPPDATCFHIGFVVHDSIAAAEWCQTLFGGEYRSWDVVRQPPFATGSELTPAKLHVVYGRFGGATLEFVQTTDGYGMHADWLSKHGPGVHHLGFWVPDRQEATRRALERGASLVAASFDASIRESDLAGMSADAIADATRDGAVYLSLGPTNALIELMSQSNVAFLRKVLDGDVERIVDLPPWADDQGAR